jgi:hypothetical protein
MNTQWLLVIGVTLLAACGGRSAPVTSADLGAATPRADCGPGSRPELGIQGRVSRAEHESGRAAEGYTCNTELVGARSQTAIGSVAGFKVERYVDVQGNDCAYYDTALLYPLGVLDGQNGVAVLDMADPTNPTLTTHLRTPAMLTPHESLVVSQARGLLVAVAGNAAVAPGVVDIYDISQDCRQPVLQSSLLLTLFGHESGISPDGKTFWVASAILPTLTAIDISQPALPRVLALLPYGSHGVSISDDGNRAYVAGIGIGGTPCAYGVSCANPDPTVDRSLIILDVSEIQARKPNPVVREVSRLTWPQMSIPQNAIPFSRDGKPYLLEFDEYARDGTPGTGLPGPDGVVGAARIIDIEDETRPRVISDLRLEVHNPEHYASIADDPGAEFIGQGYAAHYCNLPTRVNPTLVACSMIVSGLRVFDIRDVHRPREIAYFNAPMQPRLTSFPSEASGYAMSSQAFVPERQEIWYTDAYSGFYVIRLTNDVWPD